MAPTPGDVTLRRRTLRRALTFRQLAIDHSILDPYVAARSARLRGNDAWIVAGALQIDATLVTEDGVMAERAGKLLDVVLLD
jgi:predicted nucleic acid-binding protein